jgi:hypothetical protein
MPPTFPYFSPFWSIIINLKSLYLIPQDELEGMTSSNGKCFFFPL